MYAITPTLLKKKHVKGIQFFEHVRCEILSPILIITPSTSPSTTLLLMPITSHSWARFSKILLTYRTRYQTLKSESKEFWGQKCWDLSMSFPCLLLNQAISKTSDPSRPTLNKIEFWAKWVEMSACFGHGNIAERIEGEGVEWMNLKPIKQLSLGAITWVTINWKGFFTQSQVLLSSIVASKPIHFALLNWKLYHVLYRSIKIFFLNVNNNSIPGSWGRLYTGLSRNWPLGLKAML